MKTYTVWAKDYYDSPSQLWPRDDQVYGRFNCQDSDELKRALLEKGHDPNDCRWEIVNS